LRLWNIIQKNLLLSFWDVEWASRTQKRPWL
jgi:hypothetical protein